MIASLILEFIWKFAKSTAGGIVLLLILGGVVGAIIHTLYGTPKETVRTVEHTTIHTVEVPVLTEKIITKILSDPKDKTAISELVTKNNSLKLILNQMVQTIAELQSTGGTNNGGVVAIRPIVSSGDPSYAYSDWQLDAAYVKLNFTYTLHQKFEILSTTGKAKDGSKVTLVDVFQLGPNNERIPVPSKTTAIFSDESTPRWIVSSRVQAGAGVDTAREKFGVVALQWLKHGRSTAAEDTKFSILSPTLLFGSKLDVGVLPISVNVGSLPHQPFTNLWLSPLVTRTRVGVAVTATF